MLPQTLCNWNSLPLHLTWVLLLPARIPQVSGDAQVLILTFYWPINCMSWNFGRRIEGLLEEYKGSITVELQQRSVEFGSIIRRHSNMALVLQTLSEIWSFIIRSVQCPGWYNLYFVLRFESTVDFKACLFLYSSYQGVMLPCWIGLHSRIDCSDYATTVKWLIEGLVFVFFDVFMWCLLAYSKDVTFSCSLSACFAEKVLHCLRRNKRQL